MIAIRRNRPAQVLALTPAQRQLLREIRALVRLQDMEMPDAELLEIGVHRRALELLNVRAGTECPLWFGADVAQVRRATPFERLSWLVIPSSDLDDTGSAVFVLAGTAEELINQLDQIEREARWARA